MFDDTSWQIRYAIIDVRNWLDGKRVLLSPRWIERVSWKNKVIYTSLSRDLIQKSPAWDPDQPVSRKYELELHGHYGYAPYWTEENADKPLQSKS